MIVLVATDQNRVPSGVPEMSRVQDTGRSTHCGCDFL